MKRSRTIRDTLDDLFCHDTLLEESYDACVNVNESNEEEDDGFCVGLFFDEAEVEEQIRQPMKRSRRGEPEDSAITGFSNLYKEEVKQQELLEQRCSEGYVSDQIISSLKDRLNCQRPRKSGVEDITSHFMSLFAGQTALVVL